MLKNATGEKRQRLKRIMALVTAIEIVLCLFMIINVVSAKIYNEKSIELSQKHIQYTEIADELMEGSDILTDRARMFSETGDIKYMNNYFEEANTSRHRDKAMERLKEVSPSEEALNQMQASMQRSMALMDLEYRAMKLTSLAYGIPEKDLPDEIKNTELSEEEQSLSPGEMEKEARKLLFGDEYIHEKRNIMSGSSHFFNSMIEKSNREYLELTKKVKLHSRFLEIIIIIVSTMLLLMNMFQLRFVVNPLVRAAASIRRGDKIALPKFLLEMDSLGTSYNRLLLKNGKLVKQLRVLAETDALTNIGSRAAYNDYANRLKHEGGAVLLFVFDVNDLRKTNNTKGHNAGDELLRASAACILSVFGDEEDKNCFRIGGDEFVAFICGEPEKNAEKYIEDFKEEQKNYNVKISVGFAYAEDIKNQLLQDMFNKADQMMYADKEKIKKPLKMSNECR